MKIKSILFSIAIIFGLASGDVSSTENKTELKTSGSENAMQSVENSIRQLIKRKFVGEQPIGLITANSSDGGVSHSGTIELGSTTRRKIDVVEAFFSGGGGLGNLLQELYETSMNTPEGPWYHCKVKIHPDWSINFEYFLESKPFSSIDELEKDEQGSVPSFVFKEHFDVGLISELSDYDVNRGLSDYVQSQLLQGREVSKELLELYATTDWEGDVNNGAMNQYFARSNDSVTDMPRTEMYPLVHAGLLRIGANEAAAIFDESLALYSHFYPEVDAIRSNLGIPPIQIQEQSDIMQRYYQSQPQLDELRAKYLRNFGPGTP